MTHQLKNIESIKCKTTHHAGGDSVRLMSAFSSEIKEAQRQWVGIFNVIKVIAVNQESHILQN
jgi:acetolactate synthase small subunit